HPSTPLFPYTTLFRSLPGKGGKGLNGGRDGDLYLNITLHPHSLYRVSGNDIYLDLPLAPWEAVLGTKVRVPTLAGAVNMTIPARSEEHTSELQSPYDL